MVVKIHLLGEFSLPFQLSFPRSFELFIVDFPSIDEIKLCCHSTSIDKVNYVWTHLDLSPEALSSIEDDGISLTKISHVGNFVFGPDSNPRRQGSIFTYDYVEAQYREH
jgi:hypothetical protein